MSRIKQALQARLIELGAFSADLTDDDAIARRDAALHYAQCLADVIELAWGSEHEALAAVCASALPTLSAAAEKGLDPTSPWLLLVPSAVLACVLLCLNFLGDGLRDALDPRQRR